MRVLVIAPTRELVAQIEENVRAYGRHLPLRYATVFGGVGEGAQIQALRRGVDLVVATPGRLIDLTEQRHVDYSALQVLVLDEADRMLDMGFLPGDPQASSRRRRPRARRCCSRQRCRRRSSGSRRTS